MPLTVLTDADARAVLLALRREDILELHHSLADALHSYSTGDTNSACAASHQPQRIAIKRNGRATLFMPAATDTSVGMKIVSLEGAGGSNSTKYKKPSAVSVASDLSGMTLTPASTISSASTKSGSSFAPPPSVASSQSVTPKGTLTMLDAVGNPTGIMNAEELTAFRTALASTLMFQKREHVHTITVFGAGKQAYWHIRLALILKGDQIHHVNIINRSFERSAQLMRSFYVDENLEPAEASQWRKDVKFSILSPGFGEYGRLLKEQVRKADAIFCCTPSLAPLFPPEFLTSTEGRRKGRYISCIGSYTPNMIELHPDIFRQAVEPEHGHHHHKHAKSSGVVIVDSLDSCMKEAGEIIQAQLKPDNLVEIGELIMVKRAAMREVELGGAGEKGLVEWLVKGNVVYKSVGFGLMDLVVGGDVVRLARERGIGTTIQDF